MSNPKQVAKQYGWRQGKRDAQEHKVKSPQEILLVATRIFIAEIVPAFLEGYEAGAEYVQCNGKGTEWNEFYTGRKGRTSCK